MQHDTFDLQRFVLAQADEIERVREQLRGGEKRGHWMWFVFPQLAGLGHSEMARRYAIGSIDEARAYAAHPLLGPRLVECCEILAAVYGRGIQQILGSPDDLKLRSCLTLFQAAAPQQAVFGECLRKFYGGQPDERTLRLLAGG
jgi:uncharacterized protein (DUF1810 family)